MSNVWNIPEGATHWSIHKRQHKFFQQQDSGWNIWLDIRNQWITAWTEEWEDPLPINTLYNKVVPEDVWAVDDIESPHPLKARLFTGDLVLLRILLTRSKWLTITPHTPLEWQEKIFPILLAKHRAYKPNICMRDVGQISRHKVKTRHPCQEAREATRFLFLFLLFISSD